MSERCRWLVVGLILVVTWLPLVGQTYTLQAFHIPYAPNGQTQAQGINNRGAITGRFSGPFLSRGFKRNVNGVFDRPIDDPNAGTFITVASGINDSGVIVGYYFNQYINNGMGAFSGFLLYKGVFTDYFVNPYMKKSGETKIYGINNKGDFVGQVDVSSRGFVSINGLASGLNYPGAVWTIPHGIGADGTIVGYFIKNGMESGFMRGPAGQYMAIRIPGALGTRAFGVNNAAHKIVGAYTTSGYTHGFVYDYITGVITTVDWPGSTMADNTVVTGINSQGDIVGWAQPVGGSPRLPFSFIGTPQ